MTARLIFKQRQGSAGRRRLWLGIPGDRLGSSGGEVWLSRSARAKIASARTLPFAGSPVEPASEEANRTESLDEGQPHRGEPGEAKGGEPVEQIHAREVEPQPVAPPLAGVRAELLEAGEEMTPAAFETTPEVAPAAFESAAEAAPHPTHCFELTTHRAMDFTADGTVTRTAPATATTPPTVAFGTPARFRTIAGLTSNFPIETAPTANPTELLTTTRGRVLLDTGHLRVDPGHATRFQVRLRGLVCHPARAAGGSALPSGHRRYPVVVIVHGNHTALDVSLADSGGARRSVTVSTSAGPTTVTLVPARATLRHEVHSYRGYRYLQEHLAARGIVSVSVDSNVANETGSLVRLRADLVLEMLDHLRSLDASSGSPFHQRLDFGRVALVGHSRGGDAVAMAAELNRRRPTARRFGVRAVVALAPTDFTGLLAAADRLAMRSNCTASFLCVYGSHDGDVSGAFDPTRDRSQAWSFAGTGFRHYDRATTQRAMVFIHGATHNRFNSVWVDPAAHSPGSHARHLAEAEADNGADAPHVDPRLPSSSTFPLPSGHRDARVLSTAQHQTLAQEYIGGWLELWLNRRFAEQARFNGARANSLGVPVGLQWKLGRTLRRIDDFDDAAAGTNPLGGTVTRPPFVTEQIIALSNLPHCPHIDRVLQATVPSGASRVYRTTVPAGKRNWANFTALTFRIAKHFPHLATPASIAAASFPPRVRIGLFDGTRRKVVDQAIIAPLNPRTVRPYHRLLGTDNLTKVHLQTWQVPLAQFTGSGGVSLSGIQAVEITFDAGAGEPIYLDTLSLLRV